MNPYTPPEAPIAQAKKFALRPWTQVVLVPVFAIGTYLSFQLASELVLRIPPIGLSRQTAVIFFACLSSLISLGATAPWWLPVAYVYRERATLAGALIASAPAALRFVLLSDRMTNTVVTTTIIIETAGLVLLAAIGSHFAARWMGANKSFKPNPLRGSA